MCMVGFDQKRTGMRKWVRGVVSCLFPKTALPKICHSSLIRFLRALRLVPHRVFATLGSTTEACLISNEYRKSLPVHKY